MLKEDFLAGLIFCSFLCDYLSLYLRQKSMMESQGEFDVRLRIYSQTLILLTASVHNKNNTKNCKILKQEYIQTLFQRNFSEF